MAKINTKLKTDPFLRSNHGCETVSKTDNVGSKLIIVKKKNDNATPRTSDDGGDGNIGDNKVNMKVGSDSQRETTADGNCILLRLFIHNATID